MNKLNESGDNMILSIKILSIKSKLVWYLYKYQLINNTQYIKLIKQLVDAYNKLTQN